MLSTKEQAQILLTPIDAFLRGALRHLERLENDGSMSKLEQQTFDQILDSLTRLRALLKPFVNHDG